VKAKPKRDSTGNEPAGKEDLCNMDAKAQRPQLEFTDRFDYSANEEIAALNSIRFLDVKSIW
jgi:hypothetical protein